MIIIIIIVNIIIILQCTNTIIVCVLRRDDCHHHYTVGSRGRRRYEIAFYTPGKANALVSPDRECRCRR